MNEYNASYDETKLRYWINDGKWHCTVPRDDYATQAGFHWKRFGLIGIGETHQEACEDWRSWVSAAKFIDVIY